MCFILYYYSNILYRTNFAQKTDKCVNIENEETSPHLHQNEKEVEIHFLFLYLER